MARSLGLLASLASLAALASAETTVKLLVLGDESPFVGSVVKADPSVTTVLVKCLHETSDSCGLPPGGATITQGLSTWHWGYSFSSGDVTPVTLQVQADCKLDPDKELASCAVMLTQSSVESSETVETSYSTLMYPVTITAGADKLPASPAAVASDTNSMGPTASAGSGSQPSKTAASVGTGSGSQPSKTAASVGTGSENQPSKTAAGVGTGSENQPSKTTSGTASQATASSASASASASASTSTSTSSKGTNAAGPAVTQNAVLAGVAAVVGGVLAL
ncbi:uncharacterized protein UV8b_06813 [Ustilaginoidea virens]|uniref:GPI anchored protein n=1 Tax=Ustilaginoidea virens TaxID=1159556 RepID=A0A8E5HW56_USTVR|nr:uncharacterized protein UV8b_06813 [Ustilaginoidea virens]QUC22572.1 hypothetical protein UV8b_06813 [Ustilaginoidea virens]